MKKLLVVVPILILIAFCATRAARGFTINNIIPGATGSPTPTAVATASAVTTLIPCGSTLNDSTLGSSYSGQKQTAYVKICAYGGAVGTDGIAISFASLAAPCSAASPAPVASTKAGDWVPTGQCNVYNWPSAPVTSSNGGTAYLSSEIDGQASTSGMTAGRMTW